VEGCAQSAYEPLHDSDQPEDGERGAGHRAGGGVDREALGARARRAAVQASVEPAPARLEQPGWTEPGFDDSAWEQAVVRDPPGGRLVAQPMDATKIVDIVEPVAVEEVAPRVFVFDFGRIMSGWVRLNVRGPEGTTVRLAYGHRRDGDGRVERDEDLLGRPLQTDTYILRGDDEEI
jgi:alpha-L-rhamnosidase